MCFIAGADVLATDKFGKLKLNIADCKQREEIVFTTCKKITYLSQLLWMGLFAQYKTYRGGALYIQIGKGYFRIITFVTIVIAQIFNLF